MMSRHFRPSSELTGAIAKRLPHAKNQLSVLCSFFNQFVTYIYIYKHINRVLIVRISFGMLYQWDFLNFTMSFSSFSRIHFRINSIAICPNLNHRLTGYESLGRMK